MYKSSKINGRLIIRGGDNLKLKNIRKNKLIVGFLLILFLILVFCHFQTMILNDDLPYSLYFRANNRITNVLEIIKNQVFDYSHINPRIFIHSIVQFLLIFDKNLWSVVNPLIIIGIIVLMSYLINELTGQKTKFIYLIIACTLSFLLLYDYKYLIYWVAGSVNYVWVFFLFLLVILYYLKVGFTKKPVVTFFLCLIFAILCEATSIFIIVLLVFDLIKKLATDKEDKKIVIKYILYLVGAFIGFAFLMFAPSNVGRMSGDDTWASLNLLEKLNTSLPVISEKVFNVFDIYNLFPLLMGISIIYFLRKDKNLKWFTIGAGLSIVLSFNTSWGWFLFSILLLIFQSYIFIKNKDYKLIGILLGGYAVLYSLAITPEYSACRTAFHLLLIISMATIYNFSYLNGFNKIMKVIICVGVIFTITFEIIIYAYIGSVKKERDASLEKVINGESTVLEVKLIKEPFSKFHIDANNPVDKNYWAYAAFEDYYKLPEDIEIITVE